MASIPEIKVTHYRVCGSVHAVNPAHARKVSDSKAESEIEYVRDESCPLWLTLHKYLLSFVA